MYIQYDGCNIEKMNQQYSVEIITTDDERLKATIQPFGILLKDATRFPIISLQNVNSTEVTLTLKWCSYNEWVSIYGYGKLINDCLLFECDFSPNIVESVFKLPTMGSIKKVMVEDLGEVENNHNMLTDTVTLVNTRLSYLPNLINLIDLSYFVLPKAGAAGYSTPLHKRCQPYFNFGGKLLTGKKWWSYYWQKYCESLWNIVKHNIDISDSRKIIFNMEESYVGRAPYHQHIDKQFNDLRSFIDWYITFRYSV